MSHFKRKKFFYTKHVEFLLVLLLFVGLANKGYSLEPEKASKEIKVDLAKGAEVAQAVCAACHAGDGNSVVPAYPILAGQHPAYLKKQLHNFQVKPGDSSAKRANAIMLGFATQLSDADINNVSEYYGKQKIKPSFVKNIELANRGEALYRGGDIGRGIPSCSACHGPRGLGVPNQYPRLAGQYKDYTEATLLAYKNGSRANNNQMMSISMRLSEDQIEALAEYLSGLR
ncbi:MAG: hypothetical protein CBC42_03090 [Betaproteobacteria bacterium TMED82]|nr:MAG: hypothetical protein CBC42_03090 [Betaproteobacteria bacterium TMED82]|tara:strand:+ start:1742 stop:2428 length:687 start_codon:yes stop_codon:yes gene_type:complete